MKKLPKILILSSLLLLVSSSAFAEKADSYVDELSSEASETDMKADSDATVNDNEPEPSATPDASEDTDALADKVGSQLEKLLSGSSAEDVKKEDIADIVSGAVKEGHNIDAIQNAVKDAMTELQQKEGVDIKPEVFKFAEDAVVDIVNSSKDVAQGDPNDPYIQGLNAELEETSLDKDQKETKAADTKTDTAQQQATETAKPEESTTQTTTQAKSEDSATQAETESSSTQAKTEDSSSQTDSSDSSSSNSQTSSNGRTIVVLKGESLSKIAAKIYGSGDKYHLLYEANKDTISNPNRISIGQVLKVPPLPKD